MIFRASSEDGAEYRLRNRKGLFAHGHAESGAHPHGLFVGAWTMLRFVMPRRLFGTRGPTAPFPEPQDEADAPSAMSVPEQGERAFVCRVRPVGVRSPLNFRH